MHYSRRMGRRNGPRPTVQSYKKVINIAEASRTTAEQFTRLASGVDSIAAGQTSAIDDDVPTGSHIKLIEIQWSPVNLVNVALHLNWSIQLIHSGQSNVDPRLVGGNPQRNQVFRQGLISMGQSQNQNVKVKFKIPKGFQRMREGDEWRFVYIGTQVYNDSLQIIYKFYR